MIDNNFPPTYFAYLVRLWRSNTNEGWRVMVQDAHSEMQLRFDSLEGLLVFLKTQVGEPPPIPPTVHTDIATETIDLTQAPS